MTSLVLAKYDSEDWLRIITYVTLDVSRQKMIQVGIHEGACPLKQIPNDHKGTIWLEPVVCTIEYMPSDKEG